MNKLLLSTALLVAIGATPARATLQIALNIGPDNFFCADNEASCDTNPAIGIIQVDDTTLDGVQINGSIQASVLGGPFPSLNTSSLSLINFNSTTAIATVAVGDTDYAPVGATFHSAGSGTWQGPGASSATLSWFIDPANGQGADTAFDTPGVRVDSFTNGALAPTSSFSHDGKTVMLLSSPFSMAEQATVVLASGEALINRGQALVGSPIPEPSTYAMMLIGFLGLAFGAMTRKRMRAFY